MKKLSYSRLLTAASLVLGTASTFAEDRVAYSAGMTVGLRDVTYEQQATVLPMMVGSAQFAGTDVDIDFNPTLLTVGTVGGLSYGRLYANGLVEFSPDNDENRVSVSAIPTTEGIAPSPGSENPKREIDRTDVNLTAGYRVWRGLSIFGGYKYTKFDVRALEDSFFFGEKDQAYEQAGLFVGAGYTWSFADRGALSVSIGYASLKVEFSESNVEIAADKPVSFGEYRLSGSATGISYGLSWNVPVNRHWSYSAAVKFQSFKTEDNNVLLPVFNQGVNIGNSVQTDVEIEQTDTIFNLGILYTF